MFPGIGQDWSLRVKVTICLPVSLTPGNHRTVPVIGFVPEVLKVAPGKIVVALDVSLRVSPKSASTPTALKTKLSPGQTSDLGR